MNRYFKYRGNSHIHCTPDISLQALNIEMCSTSILIREGPVRPSKRYTTHLSKLGLRKYEVTVSVKAEYNRYHHLEYCSVIVTKAKHRLIREGFHSSTDTQQI